MKKFIHRDDIGDFEVPEIKIIDGKRFYVTPDGNSYPSITTVLSQQENLGIKAWKAKVGEAEAKRISKESMRIGTAVHQMAEFYLSNYIIKLKNEEKKIVDTFNRLRFLLGNINNIVGVEIPLFSDVLRVAGTTDCIAEYNGELSVIDFKTSRKPKKEEWIDDYYMQTFAYKLMFEEMTGIEIKQIVILVACVEQFEVQVFKKPAKDSDKYLTKLVNIMKENPHITGAMHQPTF
jgi:CRISPR/Cas system-associated exonuclease Cas4 (RecB family)